MYDPRPGDPSICAYCCTALIFDGALKLRLATDDEVREIDAELVAHGLVSITAAITRLRQAFRDQLAELDHAESGREPEDGA